MKRLTKRVYDGITRDGEVMCSNFCTACGARNECEHITACVERLAAYEDTGLSPAGFAALGTQLDQLDAYRAIGTPEECAAGVALLQKQQEGLAVELPCKVGDTVYSFSWSIMNQKHIVNKGTIANVRYDAADGMVTVSDGERYCEWGVRAFATRADAEKAMEGKG